MNAGLVRESFLAPAFLLAEPPQVFRKALPDIHGRLKTRLSPIDLQTISDIRVDFASPQSVSVSHRRQGIGMTLTFNMLLEQAGISPADVRLLRHQPKVASRSLLDVWRTDVPLFEAYQAIQAAAQRTSFARTYWASFIGTWDGRTIFAGLYEIAAPSLIAEPFQAHISDVIHQGGEYDRYEQRLSPLLAEYAGRLYIEWGGGASGKRAWNQRADAQDKLITELHRDTAEAPFPGLMALSAPLSTFSDAPPTWIQAMAAARGVYLLACPRDGSLYVGSATAEGGFWARWSEYRANGHGGNVALRGREPSDYVVSVLQVAGSAETADDILAAEAAWKRKLQSRELGLNRN